MSSQDEAKHICLDCGRTYKAAETLNRHRKNHGTKPNHMCSVCSAGFRRNDLLQRHMKIHQRQLSRSALPEETRPRHSTVLNHMIDSRLDLSLGTDSWGWPACDAASLQGQQTWEVPGVESLVASPPADVTTNDLMMENFVSSQFAPLAWNIEVPLDFGDQSNNFDAEMIYSQHPIGGVTPSLDQSAPSLADSESIVLDLVEYAINFSSPASNKTLQRLAARIENQVCSHKPFDASEPTRHFLDHCVKLFFKHFHPLWPILREHCFKAGNYAKHLYIVASGIGLIYLGNGAGMLYSKLLSTLRERLITLVYLQKVPEECLLSVCQALLLMQMGIWNFRDEDHVETAGLVGSTVVYLARKLNLFNDNSGDLTDLRAWLNCSRLELVQNWIKSEERKRLAFGIYRTQLCLTIATGRRPAVQWEEMNIFMPRPVHLWHSSTNELTDSLCHLAKAPISQLDYMFSDLIRVTLERKEQIPDLPQPDLQLILFALQQQVQYFCYDPESKARLHRSINAESLSESLEPTVQAVSNTEFLPLIHNKAQKDLLEQSARRMKDVRSEKARLYAGLEKWKASFSGSLTASRHPLERATLMTSHLLYSISIITLKSPLFGFHKLAADTASGKCSETRRLAYKWANTREAEVVARHACAGYSLLRKEHDRPPSERAPFDVLTEVSLFHCAVIVWVYAGVKEGEGELLLDDDETTALCRANSGQLMLVYASLLRSINPLRIGSSTFVDRVGDMSRQPLPELDIPEF